MRQVIIKRIIGAAALAVMFNLAACKGENNDERNDGNVEIIGDSIAPTGSDGLGREIDTVEQIERAQLDTVSHPSP